MPDIQRYFAEANPCYAILFRTVIVDEDIFR